MKYTDWEVGRMSFILASLNKNWHRCSSSLLKQFAGQRANLLLLLFYHIVPLSIFVFLLVTTDDHGSTISDLAVLVSVVKNSSGVKQDSLWSVQEMGPSRFSTHVCPGVINCSPEEDMLYCFSYCVSRGLCWLGLSNKGHPKSGEFYSKPWKLQFCAAYKSTDHSKKSTGSFFVCLLAFSWILLRQSTAVV